MLFNILCRSKKLLFVSLARKNHTIVKKKNFYEIIGVPRDASVQLIDDTYHAHKGSIHPDIVSEPNVANFLKQLNDAYTVIRNPELRKKYDLDLQVSGDISDYLKNVLRDVHFKRSAGEDPRLENEDGINVSDVDSFHDSRYNTENLNSYRISRKVRHLPRDIVAATSIPYVTDMLILDKINTILIALIILAFIPDTITYFYMNGIDLEFPKIEDLI